jgi:hypothetical protein
MTDVCDATAAAPERLFPGESEMACRMRAFHSSAGALGPIQNWPENLQVSLRLCLTSHFPIFLWWGPELSFLCNDAFVPWLSAAKHPRVLMQPGRKVWSEVWDTIGPMPDAVMATAKATWSEAVELYYDRKLPNHNSNALKIVAQRGFKEAFLDYSDRVHATTGTGGAALQMKRRAAVEDMLQDPRFARLKIVAAAASRSLLLPGIAQCRLRLCSAAASNCWFRQPHRPSERELRFTDLYARHAAELIERKQADQALRESEDKYRSLFESIDESFCTMQMLFDADDRRIDFRFREVIPSVKNKQGSTRHAAKPCGRSHRCTRITGSKSTAGSSRTESLHAIKVQRPNSSVGITFTPSAWGNLRKARWPYF